MTFDRLDDGDLAEHVIDLERDAMNADCQYDMENLLNQSVLYRRELVDRTGERNAALLLEELRINRGLNL